MSERLSRRSPGTARPPGRSKLQNTRENEETMNARYIATAAVVIAGAIGLAACGGGADEPASAPATPPAAQPTGDTGAAGGTILAGDEITGDDFVGMTLDQASSLAEELGRQWRVGTEDGVELPVTADGIEGRETCTFEDGVVTEATIEEDG